MKVYDVLTESTKTEQQVDEFKPIRRMKAMAGNKAAKLDIEIDKEVKDIYKDYVAVSRQDPKKQGMTVDSLSKFLAAKGFANSPDEVIAYIKQDTSLAKKLMRGAVAGGKKIAKGATAAAGAAKSGASKVGQAASKLKKKLSPDATGLTPDQPNLPGIESMYSEGKLTEVDLKLSSGEAKKIIKRFVQQGFQKQMGNRLSKSSYGDAPADTAKGSSSKADAKAMATPTMDVDSAVKFLRSLGYTVKEPKKQKQTA